MPAAARFLTGFSSRLIIAIVLAGGLFVSVTWYQHGRVEEQESARAVFVQRAAQRPVNPPCENPPWPSSS